MLRFAIRILPLLMLLGACSQDDAGNGETVTTTVTSPGGGGEMDAPPLDPQDQSLLATLDGEPLALSRFAGQHVLLNYWATWCAPCIEEIPALLNAAEALGEDYHLLLVSDESAAKIQDFLADHDFDDGNFVRLTSDFASHGVRAVPSTVLYGPAGSELRQWLGAKEWDSRDMLEQIRAAP